MERAAWIILFIAVLIALESRDPRPPAPLDAADCLRCGLGKLTDGELAAIESWVGRPIEGRRAELPREELPREERPQESPIPPADSGEVMFNQRTGVYHCLSCRSVAVCKNCVPLSRQEAKARGRACGNCRGCG